jgi:hypothetical protein
MRFANNDLMKNKLRSQELPALSCRLTITGDVSAMMFDLLVLLDHNIHSIFPTRAAGSKSATFEVHFGWKFLACRNLNKPSDVGIGLDLESKFEHVKKITCSRSMRWVGCPSEISSYYLCCKQIKYSAEFNNSSQGINQSMAVVAYNIL